MKGVMEPPWQPDYSCFICPTLTFPHSFYGLDLRRRYKGFSLPVKVWDREDPTVLWFRHGVLPDLPEAGTRRPAVTIRTGIRRSPFAATVPTADTQQAFSELVKGCAVVFRKPAFPAAISQLSDAALQSLSPCSHHSQARISTSVLVVNLHLRQPDRQGPG